MHTLTQLWNLVTNDALTLAATGVLALAILALLVLVAWPARSDGTGAPHGVRSSRTSRAPRAVAARAMVAAGASAAEVARRTGLSRDALAILVGPATIAARQKAPKAARPSLLQRVLGTRAAAQGPSQVRVA